MELDDPDDEDPEFAEPLPMLTDAVVTSVGAIPPPSAAAAVTLSPARSVDGTPGGADGEVGFAEPGNTGDEAGRVGSENNATAATSFAGIGPCPAPMARAISEATCAPWE